MQDIDSYELLSILGYVSGLHCGTSRLDDLRDTTLKLLDSGNWMQGSRFQEHLLALTISALFPVQSQSLLTDMPHGLGRSQECGVSVLVGALYN